MEILRAIGTTVLDHAILISAGVVMVTFFLQRWSDQTEGQVNAALAWLEGALEQAPDRLYAAVHPNWSVYRKQVEHRLKSTCPGFPDTVYRLALGEFDACYQFDDGTYIRVGSAADESISLDPGFMPLVAPAEQFRLRRVQARRRWRRIRRIIAGLVAYAVFVVIAITLLVIAKGPVT
ncbi:MAG: hypothetical protein V1245_08285 [Arenicellales bacterium]|jgi:hypothetical protein|nr:hypothetical protein [Arenicellales bacterium]MDP7120150.1 hypothetical protein [Arenicellales bacterium]MDP7193790.1 hypothetical protein [Arenicellales bacterium]MEE1559393.1 hypothetical protein [Arenicellales bacterium]